MQLPILFLALGALAASCAQEPAPPVTGAPEPTAAAPFPTPPQFVNWECPAGWLAKPMADRGFSACEPPRLVTAEPLEERVREEAATTASGRPVRILRV